MKNDKEDLQRIERLIYIAESFAILLTAFALFLVIGSIGDLVFNWWDMPGRVCAGSYCEE